MSACLGLGNAKHIRRFVSPAGKTGQGIFNLLHITLKSVYGRICL
ncbi:Uncharacterized protein dnm_064110 [Desulfonema magnum]|uniref:Uncharacterized protein n=1 Tax=Desulfonema magnum TaxID=45655 RepID=A0A975BRP4_9BACT|nr:Uncharacterized protein dnm_064110 [Desulfonema magnum]